MHGREGVHGMGACMVEGVCMVGTCVAEIVCMVGGVHGRGVHGRGRYAWQGGICGRGHAWHTHPHPSCADTMRYGQ